MQEDVAGTQSTLGGTEYARCSECDAVFIRREARIEATGLNDDGHSEYSELCPDCEKLDRQGERPLVTDPNPTAAV